MVGRPHGLVKLTWPLSAPYPFPIPERHPLPWELIVAEKCVRSSTATCPAGKSATDPVVEMPTSRRPRGDEPRAHAEMRDELSTWHCTCTRSLSDERSPEAPLT